MRQRTSVRAIIRHKDGILLLRRANGRKSILNLYELPGGKLGYGEQPEDTLRRYLYEDSGIHMQGSRLFDAITYIDHDDSSIQYLVLVYEVELAPQDLNVRLSNNYSEYMWFTAGGLQARKMTDLTQLVLGVLEQRPPVEAIGEPTSSLGEECKLYSDGGSRGNPGPSAAGYIILNKSDSPIEQGGEYLGLTTSSQAEYHGVRLGLERAAAHGIKRVLFHVDNMMVVNQMNGVYKIKNRELWPVYERIKQILDSFQSVRFVHVRREFNQSADKMVNRILDDRAKGGNGIIREQLAE